MNTNFDAVNKVWFGAKNEPNIDRNQNFGEILLKQLDSESDRVMQVNTNTHWFTMIYHLLLNRTIVTFFFFLMILYLMNRLMVTLVKRWQKQKSASERYVVHKIYQNWDVRKMIELASLHETIHIWRRFYLVQFALDHRWFLWMLFLAKVLTIYNLTNF